MIHRDMLRMLLPGGILSAVCAVFGWIGLFSPGWLGWSPVNPLAVKVALTVLGWMPLLWWLAFRLHLRSLWVYRNTKPVTMHVQVKVERDSEHTHYHALLRSSSESEHAIQIPVYPPRWDSPFTGIGSPSRVYVDPVSGRPLVIEFDGKRLWTMAL